MFCDDISEIMFPMFFDNVSEIMFPMFCDNISEIIFPMVCDTISEIMFPMICDNIFEIMFPMVCDNISAAREEMELSTATTWSLSTPHPLTQIHTIPPLHLVLHLPNTSSNTTTTTTAWNANSTLSTAAVQAVWLGQWHQDPMER